MVKPIKISDLVFDIIRDAPQGGMQTGCVGVGVIVTHVPTGIGCSSKNERSQHKNKAIALDNLVGLLKQYNYEVVENE